MEERLGHSNQERQEEGGATEKLFGLLWRLPSSSSRFYNSWSVIPHWCSLDIYVSRSGTSPRTANILHYG